MGIKKTRRIPLVLVSTRSQSLMHDAYGKELISEVIPHRRHCCSNAADSRPPKGVRGESAKRFGAHASGHAEKNQQLQCMASVSGMQAQHTTISHSLCSSSVIGYPDAAHSEESDLGKNTRQSLPAVYLLYPNIS